MIDEDVEVFLEHFGVKGMHWGQRTAIRKQENRARLSRVAEGTASRHDKNKAWRKYGVRGPRQAEQTIKYLDDKQERHDKSIAWLKKNRKGIAIGAGIAAGAIASTVILKKFQSVNVNKIRMIHQDFIKSKDALDAKTSVRMSALRDYAKKHGPNDSGHEGSMREIHRLNEFYQHQINKMLNKHNIGLKDLHKMKVKVSL